MKVIYSSFSAGWSDQYMWGRAAVGVVSMNSTDLDAQSDSQHESILMGNTQFLGSGHEEDSHVYSF